MLIKAFANHLNVLLLISEKYIFNKIFHKELLEKKFGLHREESLTYLSLRLRNWKLILMRVLAGVAWVTLDPFFYISHVHCIICMSSGLTWAPHSVFHSWSRSEIQLFQPHKTHPDIKDSPFFANRAISSTSSTVELSTVQLWVSSLIIKNAWADFVISYL